ncbi:hypothetical protein CAEBREN_02588 [Caenorhabditis brenneri]|uniref:Uncharacterized protein n=1 Tax=Caenorhabditis brenneri TaxID=135651 RepID=G0MG78_CAEBE|nr:hypothetical protein CAEBREN_02588 [Caenorhabditis brenneri]
MFAMTIVTIFISCVSFSLFRTPNNRVKYQSVILLCLMAGVRLDAHTTSERIRFWMKIEAVLSVMNVVISEILIFYFMQIIDDDDPTWSALQFNFMIPLVHLLFLGCAMKYLEIQETKILMSVVYNPSPIG